MILQNRNRFAESSFEESKSNRFEDFPLDSAAQRAVQGPGGFSTTPVSSKEGPLWTGDNFLLTCPLLSPKNHSLGPGEKRLRNPFQGLRAIRQNRINRPDF